MRRIIAILSILALCFTTAGTLLALYAIRRGELERNRERTQSAREKRWTTSQERKQNGVMKIDDSPKIETDEKI